MKTMHAVLLKAKFCLWLLIRSMYTSSSLRLNLSGSSKPLFKKKKIQHKQAGAHLWPQAITMTRTTKTKKSVIATRWKIIPFSGRCLAFSSPLNLLSKSAHQCRKKYLILLPNNGTPRPWRLCRWCLSVSSVGFLFLSVACRFYFIFTFNKGSFDCILDNDTPSSSAVLLTWPDVLHPSCWTEDFYRIW